MSEYNKIEPQSLRIGVYVYNTFAQEEQRLTIDGLMNMVTGNQGADRKLTGILLTPGWCEALGGRYSSVEGFATYNFQSPIAEWEDFEIQFIGGCVYYTMDKERNQKIALWWVHELQNLFFALHKSELLKKEDLGTNTQSEDIK